MEIHNNDGKFWIKSKQVEELYHELTMEIMVNIVRRLNKRGTQDLIDNPYIWQLEKLNDMHQLTEENVKLIAKYADISEEVFRDVIANEGFKIYQDSHQQLAEALGSNAQPNYLVQESLDALARQTIGDVNNLINTTLPTSIQKSYKSALETVVAGTVAGIKSHDKAVREAVIQMYNNGFTGFKDKAGRTWTAERYAKTVVRTTTFRTYREMKEQSAEDLGVDTFYYSKKAQAREMCAPLQGEIVTKGVAREIKGEKVKSLSDYGYGTPGGCLGINCGHYLTPFVIGVNYKPSSHPYIENLTPEEARQNALDMARYKAYERELKAVRDKKRLAKELNDKEYLEQLRARERTLKAGKKYLIEKNPTVIGKYPSEKVVDDIQNRKNTPIKYSKESIDFSRKLNEKTIDIKSRKVIGSEYNKLFISKEVKNKKQSIRYYDNQINQVLNNLHVSIEKLEQPRIIIVDKKESKEHVIASYNRKENTLFLRSDLANNKKIIEEQQINGLNTYAYSNKATSSLVHELGHWYQHQKAVKENPKATYEEILQINRELSRELVESYVKKGYNINKELSRYASYKAFTLPEEVYAEKFVKDYFER